MRKVRPHQSAMEPRGLGVEYRFLSVPNKEGVQFNPHRTDVTLTLTLNAVSWLVEMIDRWDPWCQGPATPLLTQAKIRQLWDLNYTFAKTSGKDQEGRMTNEKMIRAGRCRSVGVIGGTREERWSHTEVTCTHTQRLTGSLTGNTLECHL